MRFEVALVSTSLPWEEVGQLSKELGGAGGYLQSPSDCGNHEGIVYYNPQYLYASDKERWEVLKSNL